MYVLLPTLTDPGENSLKLPTSNTNDWQGGQPAIAPQPSMYVHGQPTEH